MSDLLTVALICASTVPAPDCSRETALDVVVSPARSAMECALGGQAMIAASGLASSPDLYVKIRCDRRGVATAMTRPER
jgi:hypothetical protein